MSRVQMSSDKSSGYETNSRNSAYNPGYTFYPHPFAGRKIGLTPSYRDEYLRNFSSSVRDTPDWTTNSRSRKLFAQWVQKAHKQDYDRYKSRTPTWSAEDVEFVWKELSIYRDYVEKLREKGCYVEPDIDGVWRADNIISEETRSDLIDAVSTIEDVPKDQQDWRPNSNDQILDLVDPSLWPVIYGLTLDQTTGKPIEVTPDAYNIPFCFRQMGVTEIHPSINNERNLKVAYSERFCWLPSEFKVSPDGKKTKVNSYINNLSSLDQQKLFNPIIEDIFTQFVPLFNHALADLARGRGTRARGCNKETREGPKSMELSGKAVLKRDYFQKSKEILTQFVNEEEVTAKYLDSAVDLCFTHRTCQKRKRSCDKIDHRRVSVQLRTLEPPLDMNDMWQPPRIARARRIEGRDLKVIVRMISVVLTPDRPEYKEGWDWHFEPMLNESIVATGIYYYSQENVTETGLKFKLLRKGQHTQGCACGANDYYSDRCEKVTTKQGRALVFPNILQHRLQSFGLIDRKKPGHMKILMFYLCDPCRANNMPTTRIVAPQQPEARPEFVDELRKGPLGVLPEEVFQMIINELPAPISRSEAREYRAELKDERRRTLRLVDK